VPKLENLFFLVDFLFRRHMQRILEHFDSSVGTILSPDIGECTGRAFLFDASPVVKVGMVRGCVAHCK
jgi:hypothetical protein